MSKDIDVRWGWLKGVYICTMVGAGGFGLGIILMPGVERSVFIWPNQDPVVCGVTRGVFLAFALLSILGLRSPLKFVPVLLPQLTYKSIWMVGVVLPLLTVGWFPTYAILHMVISPPISLLISKRDLSHMSLRGIRINRTEQASSLQIGPGDRMPSSVSRAKVSSGGCRIGIRILQNQGSRYMKMQERSLSISWKIMLAPHVVAVIFGVIWKVALDIGRRGFPVVCRTVLG
jgi:hypothetical protein